MLEMYGTPNMVLKGTADAVCVRESLKHNLISISILTASFAPFIAYCIIGIPPYLYSVLPLLSRSLIYEPFLCSQAQNRNKEAHGIEILDP